MEYFIGVDIGTTSTKAILVDAQGQSHGAVRQQEYPVIADTEGQHEEDPDVIYNAFTHVLHEALAAVPTDGVAPAALPACAVAFSAAMHGVIAIDEGGRPLTRLITWADTRSASVSARLKGTETAARIFAATGTPIHPMSPLSKLIWLKETQPELFNKAVRFVSIKEYIWYRLFGVFEIDHSIASATGLFDTPRLRWSELALQTAGVGPERLSTPVPVTHQRAKDGLAYIIGGGDGCLANLGSGVVSPGMASLTIGTSGAVRTTTRVWKTEEEQRLFTYLLTDGYYITGGPSNNGGNVLQWFIKTTNKDLDTLLKEAFALPPGARGLIFLPWLYGERAPMWDPGARGAFIGLRAYHGQAHMGKAITEGICYGLCQSLEALEKMTGPIDTIYASGGFTRSEAWIQQLADISGKPVRLTDDADASAMGAVLLGMLALGQLPDIAAAVRYIRPGKTFSPDPLGHQAYQPYFELYKSLYAPLQSTFDALDKLG